MRRLVAIACILSVLFLCVLPSYAYSDFDNSLVDYINVGYEEFHGNRAYYDELLLQGYAIIVSVGDEYTDEEIARFSQAGTYMHELVPSMQRGTSAPTVAKDIHSISSYPFTCNADSQYLYTDYKFYGCEAYLLNGFNSSSDSSLHIRVYGTVRGTVDYSVPASSSIYVHFGTSSSSQKWYAMFYPPAHAYGDISCIAH